MKSKFPKFQMRGFFTPSSFDEEARTVELVWSTGSSVLRKNFDGAFIESLSMDPTHVRLERLNGGAPLLDSHSQWSLKDVIGVVESASVDGKEGRAIVRFSGRDEVKPIMQDVRDGVIRNVSVGYVVHKFEKTEGDEKRLPEMRAIDWEPHELSFIPVGADPQAGVRSQTEEEFECEVIERAIETESTEVTEPVEEVQTPEVVETEGERSVQEQPEGGNMNEEQIKKEAMEAERKRCLEIKQACRKAKLGEEFAETLITEGKTIDEARAQIIDKMADAETEVRNTVVEHAGQDEVETKREAVQSALLHRYKPSNELSEAGRQYAGLSLVELSRTFVSGGATMDRREVVKRAMHSTSDFPFILANVANKSLRDAYEQSPRTYLPIVREVSVPDFKQVSRTQLGEGEALEEVLEGGEFKKGTISEGREQYSLKTYGKIVSVTRQAIINDDLGAFTRVPELHGRRVADLESDLVWEQITSNPTMGDGLALFGTGAGSHLNLGSAGAISVTTLGELRKLMRVQVGLDSQKLNVMPRWLIVPAALESVAEQFLAQSVFADSASSVNPFAGKLGLIVEPRLDDDSATAYYMAADVGQLDIIELARLEGQSGPFMETKEGFEVDGVAMKVRIDVAAKVIDHRGLAKNAG